MNTLHFLPFINLSREHTALYQNGLISAKKQAKH